MMDIYQELAARTIVAYAETRFYEFRANEGVRLQRLQVYRALRDMLERYAEKADIVAALEFCDSATERGSLGLMPMALERAVSLIDLEPARAAGVA